MEDGLIVAVDPHDSDARAALSQYLSEILARVEGMSRVDVSQADDVDDYTAPGGCFLLIRRADAVVGCGAVRTLEPHVGELKRMWIHPEARGVGLGSRLLARLIEESRALGHTRLVLDTNGVLVEALALYRRHGFVTIDRYNDNPDATHFLGRAL